MNEYLADFQNLRLHVEVVSSNMETRDHDGHLFEVKEYQMLDEQLWKLFVKKWQIPKSVDYELLLRDTRELIPFTFCTVYRV